MDNPAPQTCGSGSSAVAQAERDGLLLEGRLPGDRFLMRKAVSAEVQVRNQGRHPVEVVEPLVEILDEAGRPPRGTALASE